MREGRSTFPKGRSAAPRSGGVSRPERPGITPPQSSPEGRGPSSRVIEGSAQTGVVAAAIPPGHILVGRIGAPQGVRGQVRVQSFTADPLAVGTYGELRDAQGRRTFVLSGLRTLRDTIVVASIAGVSDRDDAAALTGTDLYARRDALPPPDEDEVYLVDLIGCEAFDEDGARIGTIVAVPNFGAGDILEIAPVAGGETLLLPFTKACVPTVDVAAKRVVVIIPPETDDVDTTDPA